MAQRHDFHIVVAGAIQRGNDLAHAHQVVGVIGNHQRVVAGVGVDDVVGGDERTQHRHQIRRRFTIEVEYLGSNLITARAVAVTYAALQFGIRFGDDLAVTVGADHRIALHTQHGGQ